MFYGDKVRMGTLLCKVEETWDSGEVALRHPNGSTYLYWSKDVFPPLAPDATIGYVFVKPVRFLCPECGAIKPGGIVARRLSVGTHSQTCHECGRLVIDGDRVQGVPFPQPPLENWPKHA